MATSFEPRASFRSSQARPNASSTTTMPAADSLPNLDFGFEDLRTRMAAFTTRFDEHIGSGRKRVLSDRNTHRAHLAELAETSQLKSRSIASLEASVSSHSSTIQKEAAETAEMKGAISNLQNTRDSHVAKNQRLAGAIAEAREKIADKEAAQRAYTDKINEQAGMNGGELGFYEEYLGLRIESPADDEIAFVFCDMDERDVERECEVVLDLSRRDYSVKATRPRLRGEAVEKVVERLNEGRDLGPFLKEMRTLFRQKCRE